MTVEVFKWDDIKENFIENFDQVFGLEMDNNKIFQIINKSEKIIETGWNDNIYNMFAMDQGNGGDSEKKEMLEALAYSLNKKDTEDVLIIFDCLFVRCLVGISLETYLNHYNKIKNNIGFM